MAECRITLIMPHSSPQNLIISVDRCLVFMVFMDGKDNVFMTAVRFVLTKLTFLLYVYPLLLLCNCLLFDVIFFLLAVLLSKNEVGDSILFFHMPLNVCLRSMSSMVRSMTVGGFCKHTLM